jgi:phosphatidylglycerophosphate synthase
MEAMSDSEDATSAAPGPALERRPLASRQTRWAQALAGAMARRRISPNAISLIGLAAGLLAGGALAATAFLDEWPRRLAWLVAAASIQLRLLANLLDGMVAVAAGLTSRVGELYNELPDRFSDAATLIGLGYAAGGHAELGYLAALAAVLTAYVRALGKTAGAPQIYLGPMAKPQRMFLVTLCALAGLGLPSAWLDVARLPTWTLTLCLAGAIITIVRRLIHISRHLRIGPGEAKIKR